MVAEFPIPQGIPKMPVGKMIRTLTLRHRVEGVLPGSDFRDKAAAGVDNGTTVGILGPQNRGPVVTA
jgi:hypothetical protein